MSFIDREKLIMQNETTTEKDNNNNNFATEIANEINYREAIKHTRTLRISRLKICIRMHLLYNETDMNFTVFEFLHYRNLFEYGCS